MKNILKPLNTHEAHFTVNNFAKIYPTGLVRVFEYRTGFKKLHAGLEPLEDDFVEKSGSDKDSAKKADERSIRRSKTVITDLVISNDFDMFATFTFKDHRQDIEMCKSRMMNWLKSQQKQWGKFRYIIVPEFHKDGKSLHFHALFSQYKGYLVDSGKKINNRTAYNIKSYKGGYSTIVKIDNQKKVANYVKKYITKDMPRLSEKKRYWHSTNLKKPTITYNINLDNFSYLKKIFETENFTISETEGVATARERG